MEEIIKAMLQELRTIFPEQCITIVNNNNIRLTYTLTKQLDDRLKYGTMFLYLITFEDDYIVICHSDGNDSILKIDYNDPTALDKIISSIHDYIIEYRNKVYMNG